MRKEHSQTHDTSCGIPRGTCFYYLSGIALLVFFAVVLKGWSGSLLEYYAFRQTQTAISVYYMLKGGSLVAYETPVLGYPWSIPMEFPFYQYLVLLWVKVTGYPLDQAGRLVSLAMFLSGLYPLLKLLEEYFISKSRLFILLCMVLISPQYIYWSRAFMIESTALSLSLWYLYLIKKYFDCQTEPGKYVALISVLLVGILAAVTKVTTFFVYYLVAVMLIALSLPKTVGGLYRDKIIRNAGLVVSAIILPALAIIAWTRYTDQIKSLNVLGSFMTSASLKPWTFGSFALKVSPATWETILLRSATDLFGSAWCMLVFLFLPWCRRYTMVTVIVLLVMYLVPMAVFTNLHFIHSYYVYANGILLIAAAALVISDLSAKSNAGLLLSVVVLLVFAYTSFRYYTVHYVPYQGVYNRYQDMKKDVDRYTAPHEVLLVYGADWSSEIPYYLERRALMFPDAVLGSKYYQMALDRLKGYPLGGMVFCAAARSQMDQQLEKLHLTRRGIKIHYHSCDVYYLAKEQQP